MMRIGLRGSRATLVAAGVVVLVALPMSTLPLLHDLGSDDLHGGAVEAD